MSDTLAKFIFIYGCMVVCFFFIGLGSDLDLECFNPIRNYNKHKKFNWFGIICFTILMHVLYPIYALIYWFIRLITVGRKQGEE